MKNFEMYLQELRIENVKNEKYFKTFHSYALCL